jgi:hypothetical protein
MTSLVRTLVCITMVCCNRVDHGTVQLREKGATTLPSEEPAATPQPTPTEVDAPEPLPSCREGQSASSIGLHGLTPDQVRARFGPPLRQGTFRVEELQGEFFAPLANTYPTTDPKNRNVPLQQWTWTSGDCILTVWFHNPKGTWLALDDVFWHKDTAF